MSIFILLAALFSPSQAYIETTTTSLNVPQSFIRNKLVPDVLSYPPTILVQVAYNDGSIVLLGNELSVTSVVIQPNRVFWDADPNFCFTLAMVDPDAPSRNTPVLRNVKHWLIVNIQGNNLPSGTTLASYLSPTPPPGSGLHRYTFLVFLQPSCMNFNENILEGNVDRFNFDVNEFARKYNLKPFAGNFFVARTL